MRAMVCARLFAPSLRLISRTSFDTVRSDMPSVRLIMRSDAPSASNQAMSTIRGVSGGS